MSKNLVYRMFYAIALFGMGVAAYRALPVIWVELGPATAFAVGVSLAMSMTILLFDVVFARSIFSREEDAE